MNVEIEFDYEECPDEELDFLRGVYFNQEEWTLQQLIGELKRRGWIEQQGKIIYPNRIG